jgi:hypothetical protein
MHQFKRGSEQIAREANGILCAARPTDAVPISLTSTEIRIRNKKKVKTI